ncbi:MAG: Holliday junction resolvase Hjc [Nanoarchaeota archaeon]
MKKKGSRLERELFHMFWETKGWGALRVAGSGSTTLPAPDLIVGNGSRVLAIECKSGKGRRDIRADQVEELKLFSKIFGAEPWVGVRFDNRPWYFLKVNDIGKTKGEHYFVDENLVLKNGIAFNELIGKFKQKKL